MSSILDFAYSRSPVFLQNVGVTLYGYYWRIRRQSGSFPREVAAFSKRDTYGTEQWDAYQTARLRELLTWSFTHVPAYRRKWSSLGVTEADLRQMANSGLRSLPLTDRDYLRQSPTDYVADSVSRRKLKAMHTSGSTGSPITIYLTSKTHQVFQAAYEVRCRHWASVDCSMSRAMIGGRLVVPQTYSKPPFWRYNAAERQLYMSAFHISPENTPAYVKALNHFRPDYLVGYASAHFFLARMIEESRLSVHRPKAILTSSEKLTHEMRSLLERVYSAPVFDAYSGVECCCLASECSQHSLHLSPDVGIVELLDEYGRPVEPGQTGEIVATGLLNFDQPLIRYRTGDLARISSAKCACGSAMPVLEELVGRLEDSIIAPDGRETVRFHGIFIGLPFIREGQVVQETINHIRVRLVITGDMSGSDRSEIIRRVRHRLGEVRVDLEIVPAIERTLRGKFRAVISKVSRPSRSTALPMP